MQNLLKIVACMGLLGSAVACSEPENESIFSDTTDLPTPPELTQEVEILLPELDPEIIDEPDLAGGITEEEQDALEVLIESEKLTLEEL